MFPKLSPEQNLPRSVQLDAVNNPLLILAMLVVAALSVFADITIDTNKAPAFLTSSPPLLLATNGMPSLLSPTNDALPKLGSTAPEPGYYVSKPYTMVVIVPKACDPGLTISSAGTATPVMPVIKPRSELEKP